MIARVVFGLAALFALVLPAQAEDAVAEAALAARDYRQANERRILEDYLELLSLPNNGRHNGDIRRNAEHISGLLRARGITTRLIEHDGAPPVIYGVLDTPGASKTITFYVHYDGQPVFPENWATPPFEPTLRSGRLEDGAGVIALEDVTHPIDPDWRIYGRSASDDKAPIIAILTALDAMKAAGIAPSVNMRFFLEGEEELGSPHLKAVLEENAALLASDFWLFLDGPTDQRGNPRVVLGVRGSTGVNLTTYGPVSGLHSGHYGNFVPNPVARMARLIASMRDDDGRITIDGFYDDVAAPDAASLALIDAIPEADADIMTAVGIGGREHGGMRYEETILWPALNVQGFVAGGVEAEARNVIVPTAKANLGFRLVPDQTLERLAEVVEAHIRGQGYHIVRNDPDMETRLAHDKIIKVDWRGGYGAVRTSPDNPIAARLIEIMQQVTAGGETGEVLVYPTLGGSLPLAHITSTLDVPLVVLPIVNQDNSQHAPNENIQIGYLWRGIEYYAAIFAGLGLEAP